MSFALHPNLFHHSRRAGIRGVASSFDAVQTKLIKTKFEQGFRQLGCVASPPAGWGKFIANIRSGSFWLLQTDTTHTDKLARFRQRSRQLVLEARFLFLP